MLLSNPAKARKMLGWHATTSLEEGIEKTVAWLKEHLGLYSHDRFYA